MNFSEGSKNTLEVHRSQSFERLAKAGAVITTLAKDEAFCFVYGMPKAAFEFGGVQAVVPLAKIAETILRKLN